MQAIFLKLFSFLFCFCLISLTFFCPYLLAQKKESFKIGVMLCQTGNCADWGFAALKGAQLAVEKLNSSGGLLSRDVELIVEDTSESISGANTVSAFQSLLSKKLNYYIGPSWSPGALAIAPIAKRQAKIILITPSASAREFSRSAPYIFNMRPPEELATRALAAYAINNGKKRAAIFSSQQSAESTQGQIFEDEFEKLGGEVTVNIEAIPTQTELKTEALKIIKTSPDVIFLMNYNQMETGIKDLKNLGYKGMKMAISLDDARIASAGDMFENLIIAKAGEPSTEFKDTFHKRFGEAPGLSAEGGYDAVGTLEQAIKNANTFEVSKVLEKLQHDKFDGAIGVFNFDQNREVVQIPELFVVTNGKLQPVSKKIK